MNKTVFTTDLDRQIDEVRAYKAFTTELDRLTDEVRALWYLPGMSPSAAQWPEILALASAMKKLIAGHYAAHRAQRVEA